MGIGRYNPYYEEDLYKAFYASKEPIVLLNGSVDANNSAAIYTFQLIFHPRKRYKGEPYRLKGINNDWDSRFEAIRQAQMYLQKQFINPIKWTKVY